MGGSRGKQLERSSNRSKILGSLSQSRLGGVQRLGASFQRKPCLDSRARVRGSAKCIMQFILLMRSVNSFLKLGEGLSSKDGMKLRPSARASISIGVRFLYEPL